MTAAPHDRAAGNTPDVSRRQLLHIAGAVGLAAAVGACSGRPGANASTPEVPTSSASPTLAAPPPPTVPPAPALPPASDVMLCRAAWGAKDALPGGRPHSIAQMTIHHTGAVLGDNRNAPARLRQHQQLHQGERGWIDIAYHVGVDRNGNIYQLRDYGLVGDTATEYDPTGHFLVLCEGDFDQEAVSEAQLDSAAMAFAWAVQNFRIGVDTLGSHRKFAATACPGKNLHERVTSGDLSRRIDALLARGPVKLETICGPEAEAKVAAIAGR